MPTPPLSERVPYSAIVDRPPLKLPDGARMVVWTIVNVENWSIAQAAKDAGWEFMAHGYVQGPMHKVEDQRAAIRDTIAAIRDFTGKAPRGWESPGLTETNETIDFLAAEGIEYVADWVLDDQPVYISTAHGPVVSIPYTVETNDIPMMLIQHHGAEEMLKRG